jgi:DNA-binding response OmpR family regulator
MSAKADSPPNSQQAVRFPHGWADLACGEVRLQGGQRCLLTGCEAALLRYLAAHAGRLVSRDEILWNVWRLDPRKTLTRTIDMHIVHLRDKLRDDPAKPRVLLTVHGEGYMLATAQLC